MALTKTEKPVKEEPLEKQLWKAADKLRKNIDAAEYKHVVLGLIFLKYISDSFEEMFARLQTAEGEYGAALAISNKRTRPVDTRRYDPPRDSYDLQSDPSKLADAIRKLRRDIDNCDSANGYDFSTERIRQCLVDLAEDRYAGRSVRRNTALSDFKAALTKFEDRCRMQGISDIEKKDFYAS